MSSYSDDDDDNDQSYIWGGNEPSSGDEEVETKEPPKIPPVSHTQQMHDLRARVDTFVNLWRVYVEPTLLGTLSPADVDMNAYCHDFRYFLQLCRELDDLHQRRRRSLTHRLILAPAVGILQTLRLRQVQVVLPDQCEAFQEAVPRLKRVRSREVLSPRQSKRVTRREIRRVYKALQRKRKRK